MLMGMVEKRVILNLRLSPEVRDQFAIASKLRGASMSGLIHQFIVRTIREEKELSPQSFHAPHTVPMLEIELSNGKEAMKRKA